MSVLPTCVMIFRTVYMLICGQLHFYFQKNCKNMTDSVNRLQDDTLLDCNTFLDAIRFLACSIPFLSARVKLNPHYEGRNVIQTITCIKVSENIIFEEVLEIESTDRLPDLVNMFLKGLAIAREYAKEPSSNLQFRK